VMKLLPPFIQKAFSRKHTPDAEALSALADGRLGADEAASLRTHMASCAACTSRFGDLSRVQSMLGAMPRVEAPRSFRLRRADVEQPARVPAQAGGSGWTTRAMPALAGVATVLFVAVLAVDSASNDGTSRSGGDGMIEAQSAGRSDSFGAYDLSPQVANGMSDDAAGGTGADGDAAPPDAGESLAESPAVPQPDAGTPLQLDLGAVATATARACPECSMARGPNAYDARTAENQPEGIRAAADDDGDDRTGWRIAEVGLAAIAIGAAGVAIFSWRKRQT
jgi:hypothetical protein